MSRRAADKAIADGRVLVNGTVAELGQKIDPNTDIILLDGKQLGKTSLNQKKYILLNKPRGYVTTLSDEKGRKNVAQLVSDCGVRVYPVGRLDMDSEGLLLLTDDGDLTYRLTHPKHDIPKIYYVTLCGVLDNDTIASISAIREIDGYKLAPVSVKAVHTANSQTTVEMILYEGRNRQIRKMCDKAGLKITRLQRVAIGNLSLGNLPIGKWRYLTDKEVNYLYGKEKTQE